MKKLSIIVPVYNVENWLSRCASSLINQDLDKSEYEIIFVNDGSTDDSFDVLKAYESEKVVLLRREDGRQFGAGINFGLRYLEKQGITHTFISNSDIEISCEEELKKIIKHKKKTNKNDN